MTVQLEKVFFNYILKNRKFFTIVKPYFFRNSEIQFVYEVISKYMLKSTENKVPSPRQILDMVSIEDKEGKITKPILKSILQIDLSDYSEKDFIIPKFNTWILSNRIKTGTVDVIDETRNLDEVGDFDSAIEIANKIKHIIGEMSSTKFIEDESLGSDFDDPESHSQESSLFKVSSGFETIDHMLGGGWDTDTLNVIMGETNNGKCSHYNTMINIKVKGTNKYYTIKIGDFFSKLKLAKI